MGLLFFLPFMPAALSDGGEKKEKKGIQNDIT